MSTPDYSFYRTELRVIQIQCDGDNDKFLTLVGDMLGKLTDERDTLHTEKRILENKILVLNQ